MRVSLCIALALLAIVAGGRSGAVPLTIPSVVVSDRNADPLSRQNAPGAILMMRYLNFTTFISSAALGFRDPEGVAIRPDRKMYVADSSADPLGLGEPRGAIFLVNPADRFDLGVAQVVAASPLFTDPTDLILEPDGQILVADPNADPYERGRRTGAIFRVDPSTGNVSVVSASPLFSDPRSLAQDTDGSILILDRTADPFGTGVPAGALFRLHPASGAVATVRAFDAVQTRRPMAVAVLPDGDYAICDQDADPTGVGQALGAIFRLRKSNGALEPLITSNLLLDPVDMAMGVGNILWVLDLNSNFDGNPSTRGGVIGFSLDTGQLRYFQSHTFLREPAAVAFADGPAIDSTRVVWTDETGGGLEPGDLVTMRATIRSRGTRDAIGVTLVDSIAGTWDFIAGSDSVSSGQLTFDPVGKVLRWSGDVPTGSDAKIRVRFRLDPSFLPGASVQDRVSVALQGAEMNFEYRGTVNPRVPEGAVLFVDRAIIQSQPGGYIFQVDSLSTTPKVLWAGHDLKEPLDAVLLEDGTLAILDRAAVPVQGVGTQAILLYSGSNTLRVGWSRRQGDGLIDPRGLALDLDGTLLLVDRESNPFGLEFEPDPSRSDFGPGAVYRVDLAAGTVTPWFSDARMRDPMAIGVDSRGIVVVSDLTGPNGNGAYWEYDRTDESVTLRPVNENWFRDPLGFCFDAQDNLIATDVTHFNDEVDRRSNGTLFRINRGEQTTYQILSQSSLLVDPADCWMNDEGLVYFVDRDADPLDLDPGDAGAVFTYDTRNGELSIAAVGVILNQPAGIVGRSPIRIHASELEWIDRNGGELEGGDSLDVSLRVVNATGRPVPAFFTHFELGPKLELLDLSATLPGAGFDPAIDQGSWTGELARNDTLDISLLLRVEDDVAYGETVEARARIHYSSHVITRAVSRPVRGGFRAGELVAVDEAADPGGAGTPSGAIFRLPRAFGSTAIPIFSGEPWIDPSAVEFDSDGTLYVADRAGGSPGRIYRIDTDTGEAEPLLPELPELPSPVDLLFAPDGDLLIVDRDAPTPFPEAKGAVYRLDGTSGPLTPFAVSNLFRSPSQLTFDAEGRLFLTDRTANPDSAAGNTGAIFELDPEDGTVLRHFQFAALPEPTGIDLLSDGRLVVTDTAANPRGYPGPHGTLFVFDPQSGSLNEFLTHPTLVQPYRSLVQQEGTILILDRSGSAPGQQGNRGTIHHFDPVARTLQNFGRSDAFLALADLAELPASLIELERYVVEDPNGAPLYPADRLSISVRVRNAGASVARSASFVDSLPQQGRLVSGSVQASGGTVSSSSSVVQWSGDLAPGQSVELRYDFQLDPFLAEGQVLRFQGRARGPDSAVRSVTRFLSVFVPLTGGHIYLADAAADPLGLGNQPGAILKIDQRTGETAVYATYEGSREPIEIVLTGSRPMFYVLDQLYVADTFARGGLFEIDPSNGTSRLVATDSTWFRPEDVLALGDDALLVLDGFADPRQLTPGVGPGALYRVDLPDGNVELVYSDTTLVYPRALALLPDGRIAIVDSETDPLELGRPTGGVYALDLESSDIELLAAYPEWVDPVELALEDEEHLLVIDASARPRSGSPGVGAVWRVELGGKVSLASVSDHFRRLASIVVPIDGRALLSDADATVGAGAVNGGAVFRYSRRRDPNGQFFPIAANRLLLQPQGMVLFDDVTPIVYLPFSAQAGENGIVIEWEGLGDPEDARYLIYRRPATGPDDDAAADDYPAGYSMVSEDPFRGPGLHRAVDTQVEPGAWYVYRIAVAYHDGTVDYTTPLLVQAPFTLLRFTLLPGRPTPFHESVQIGFTLPKSGETRLTIHDVGGRRVAELVDGVLAAGHHVKTWDGRDRRGHELASGIYFARLEQAHEVLTERLVLLRR